jgi:hypothetical protein
VLDRRDGFIVSRKNPKQPMQHHMYTLDARRQKWQILLIDEDDLLELAYRGQVTDESLLYNPETKNFISAKEYALLIGNARGLRVSRASSTTRPSTPHAGASLFGSVATMSKSFDLPSEPHNLGTPLAESPAWSSTAVHDAAPLKVPAPLNASSPSPVSPAWKTSLYSHTDEIVDSYVPTFRTSVRLQIIGLLMLPLFGLGLPFFLEGCRRRNHILRLVEQTGMDKAVWMNHVGNRVATFHSEQKALQMAAAFICVVAASVAVGGMSKASVRSEIRQVASDLSPSAFRPQRARRSHTSSGLHTNILTSQRNIQ